MRKYYSITIITFFLSINYSFGQGLKNWTCNTPEPKTDFLLENFQLRNLNPFDAAATKSINVFFHVVRQTNGAGGLTQAQVDNVLCILNADFFDHYITFVETGRAFINNDYYFFSFNETKFGEIIDVNDSDDRIDIYLLPEGASWAGQAAGIPSTAIVIEGDLSQTSVSSHEVGHCLGLYHTHSGRGCNDGENCQEAINGSNCSTCGDLVCDTPADPCLTGNVDGTCSYTGGGGFTPNVSNYMSYTFPDCMDNFTVGQRNRMHSMINLNPTLQNVVEDITVSGPEILCSSNTYSITGIPAGSTVTWSVAPAWAFTGNTNGIGTSATISPSTSASQIASITFVFSTECGNSQAIRSFWVGRASVDIIGPFDMQFNTVENFYAQGGYPYENQMGLMGITNFAWSVYPSGYEWIGNQGSSGITLTISNAGNYSLELDATNPCGVRGVEIPVYVYDPWSMFMIYPNPASDIMTVSKKSTLSSKQVDPTPFEISVFDSRGQQLAGPVSGKEDVGLDVSHLKNGFYYVHILYKGHLIKNQVKIER